MLVHRTVTEAAEQHSPVRGTVVFEEIAVIGAAGVTRDLQVVMSPSISRQRAPCIARSLAKLMDVVDLPSPGKLDTTPMTLQR